MKCISARGDLKSRRGRICLKINLILLFKTLDNIKRLYYNLIII